MQYQNKCWEAPGIYNPCISWDQIPMSNTKKVNNEKFS